MCEPNRENPESGRGRPNIADIFSNMRRRDIGWRDKFRMAAANNWRKIRTRQNCCGNLGQPGC